MSTPVPKSRRKKTGRNSNGLGSISQRKDGRFQGSVQRDGKRKTVYAATREEVQKKIALLDFDTQEGAKPLLYYAEEHAISLRPGSRATYLRAAELYLAPFMKKPVDELKARDLSLHLRKLAKDGFSKSVLSQASSILKTALDVALEDGDVDVNLARDLRRKLPQTKVSNEVVSWGADQVKKFEDYLASIPEVEKRWIEAAFLLRVRHGLRPSELLGLRVEDFHDGKHPFVSVRGQFQRMALTIRYRPVSYEPEGSGVRRRVLPEKDQRVGAARVPTVKTEHSLREIDIDDRTARAIRAWMKVRSSEIAERQPTVSQAQTIENQERRIAAGLKSGDLPEGTTHFTHEDALWTCRTDDACTPVSFEVDTRAWKTAVEAAGLPHVARYSGRHTAATRALEDDVPIEVISRNLGHGNVAITHGTYVARDAQREQRRAAGSRFSD